MNATNTSCISVEKERNFERFATQLASRGTEVVVFESMALLTINFTTLASNLLLCTALYRNPALRSITNIFIFSLALADILMGILCMPLSAGVMIQSRWMYGDFACIIQCFLIYYLSFISLQTITLTSINRYYRVVKTSRYSRIFTVKSTLAMVFLIWVGTGVILAVPFLTGVTRAVFNPAKAACVMYEGEGGTPYNIVFKGLLLAVFAVAPTIILIVSYYRVFRAVGGHFTRVNPVLHASGSTLRSHVTEISTTRTLFAIVIAFSLCWLPVFVIEALQAFAIEWWKLSRSCQLVWLYFGCLSSAVNPFVYALTSKDIRREYKRIVFWWKGKNESNRPAVANSKLTTDALSTVHLANLYQS